MYGWLALEIMSKGTNIYIIVNHTKLIQLKQISHLVIMLSLSIAFLTSCLAERHYYAPKQYRCVVGKYNYWRH